MNHLLVTLFLSLSIFVQSQELESASFCDAKKDSYRKKYSESTALLEYADSVFTAGDNSKFIQTYNETLEVKAGYYGLTKAIINYRNELANIVPQSLQRNATYLGETQEKYYFHSIRNIFLETEVSSQLKLQVDLNGTYAPLENLFGFEDYPDYVKRDNFLRNKAIVHFDMNYSLSSHSGSSLKVTATFGILVNDEGLFKITTKQFIKQATSGSIDADQFVQAQMNQYYPECL